MAYNIPSFQDANVDFTYTDLYLKINVLSLDIPNKRVNVQLVTYSSKTARETGKSPMNIQLPDVAFIDDENGTLYSSTFSIPPDINTPTPAVNVDSIFLAQAYIGLKNHPATSSLLSSATAI